ncbi:MAG: hypothetical protein WCY25_10490 [Moheibacter sp.]
MKTKLQIPESRMLHMKKAGAPMGPTHEILDDRDVMDLLHISRRTLCTYNQEKIIRSFKCRSKRFYFKHLLI